MTALPEEKRYTYADLLSWEGDVRYELYDGYPMAMSSPSLDHQTVSGELFLQIGTYLRGKKCRVFYAPFDVRIFEQDGDLPQDVRTVLQPDLVVEILSDSTRRVDLLKKFDIYQRAGVREYWIVDPEARTAAVYTLEGGSYRSPAALYRAGNSVPVGVLEGFQVDLRTVFPELEREEK